MHSLQSIWRQPRSLERFVSDTFLKPKRRTLFCEVNLCDRNRGNPPAFWPQERERLQQLKWYEENVKGCHQHEIFGSEAD